ncbi:hypothetical protein [uncultured Rikenella sp.]|uniref:hypothetical protein n=1 Tax=uncultured Rikenella sp. TaxID=368003 RepID=UPI00272BAF7C|nr:hypothetical protein [uncultured Rikenella sp.]
MKKLSSLLLCTATCLVCSSCATIFCGSRAKVTFNSNVPVESATLTIDGQKHTHVSFPYRTKIKRGFRKTEVTAEASGYEKTNLTVYKNFNAASLLNILLGGIIGLGVDAATGAMMKPDEDYYLIQFTPVPKAETAESDQ